MHELRVTVWRNPTGSETVEGVAYIAATYAFGQFDDLLSWLTAMKRDEHLRVSIGAVVDDSEHGRGAVMIVDNDRD